MNYSMIRRLAPALSLLILAICTSALAYSKGYVGLDSSVILRYDIAVGTSYNYDIKTDQHVVSKSAVRMETKLALDVIGKDMDDNYSVRLRVRSDSTRTPGSERAYRPTGPLNYSGNRLFSSAGKFDASLDALGRVIMGQDFIDGPETSSGIQTQFERTTDASVADGGSTSTSSMLNFTVPALPYGTQLIVGKKYYDTLYIPSKVVDVPTSYGAESKVVRKEFIDTIYREMTLDSLVEVSENVTVVFMKIESKRHNRFGAKFLSSSQMRRDVRTGMVLSLSELCYRVTPVGPELEYNASATLTSTSPFVEKANK